MPYTSEVASLTSFVLNISSPEPAASTSSSSSSQLMNGLMTLHNRTVSAEVHLHYAVLLLKKALASNYTDMLQPYRAHFQLVTPRQKRIILAYRDPHTCNTVRDLLGDSCLFGDETITAATTPHYPRIMSAVVSPIPLAWKERDLQQILRQRLPMMSVAVRHFADSGVRRKSAIVALPTIYIDVLHELPGLLFGPPPLQQLSPGMYASDVGASGGLGGGGGIGATHRRLLLLLFRSTRPSVSCTSQPSASAQSA